MHFLNMSFNSPSDYKKFIKKHKYKKTKRSYWSDIADKGKKVIAYSECINNEEWKEIYFEFVDSDLNIYVDFFNKETEEWIESYVFFDYELAWTIQCDNHMYGNPLEI